MWIRANIQQEGHPASNRTLPAAPRLRLTVTSHLAGLKFCSDTWLRVPKRINHSTVEELEELPNTHAPLQTLNFALSMVIQRGPARRNLGREKCYIDFVDPKPCFSLASLLLMDRGGTGSRREDHRRLDEGNAAHAHEKGIRPRNGLLTPTRHPRGPPSRSAAGRLHRRCDIRLAGSSPSPFRPAPVPVFTHINIYPQHVSSVRTPRAGTVHQPYHSFQLRVRVIEWRVTTLTEAALYNDDARHGLAIPKPHH
ncbi:hypothetical protein B0H14DRAFT_2655925, partial [Mycena olivaceomarginata]